jgi:hypothetical protein
MEGSGVCAPVREPAWSAARRASDLSVGFVRRDGKDVILTK